MKSILYCRKARCVLEIVSLFILFNGDLAAQQDVEYSQDAERSFQDALALYKKGDYTNAALNFRRVGRDFSGNQRTTAALLMEAKAHLYGGNTADAESALSLFLRKYSNSNYAADAEYTLGLVHLKKLAYERALESFVNGWRIASLGSDSPGLKKALLIAIDSTAENYFSAQQLQRFVGVVSGGTEKELLLVILARKYLYGGEYAAANAVSEEVGKLYPISSFPERLQELKNLLSGPHDIKIGVILPLMKKSGSTRWEKEIGNGLLEGITLALEEYDQSGQVRKISLEIRDTESDPLTAARLVRELADDNSVMGVIGPAFSPEATAAGKSANERSIPMVTPTANSDGIAASGRYVFQASPDFQTRAKAMASYAVTTLGLKRLAVLASREPTSRLLADEFERECKRLGATILTTEWYNKGVTDFTQQMNNLRRKAAGDYPHLLFGSRVTLKDLVKLNKLGVPMRTLDSLMFKRSIVNAVTLLGDDARTLLTDNGIPFTKGDPALDSLQHGVTALQGLYCPVNSSGEIGIVASQIAFFGIETVLLGSGEWNNITELNASKRYTNGVFFEADSYTDGNDVPLTSFRRTVSLRYGHPPSKENYYGYDAAKLLLSALSAGGANRELLRNSLSDVRAFTGLHSKISLFPRRVNSWLHILQYSNEAIRHVAEVQVE